MKTLLIDSLLYRVGMVVSAVVVAVAIPVGLFVLALLALDLL